ncbi:MAG: radical SAM protein, partial [Kiritimatiellae bacterium]|nr:radical SAM protein [Kiritimatiellia bacterium]
MQQFSVHDGPGIRTVAFLKGCPLRCAWCHNPETQRAAPEIRRVPSPGSPGGVREELVGRDVPVAELLDLVRRDAPFYGREGGLTLSGGEPMAQPEGALALLAAAREAGIGTCVETSGAFDPALAPCLAALADLVFFDLKDTDEARFRENTGGDLAAVLRTLRALDDAGADLALRCVLVPGVNLLKSHARAVADVFRSLRYARCVELLPYHLWGVDKAVQTGRTQRVFETPDPAAVDAFARVLRDAGVPVKRARIAAALSPRIRRLQAEALAHDIMPAPVSVLPKPPRGVADPVRIGRRLAAFMDAQPVLLRPDQELLGWLPFDGSVEADVFTRRGHEHFWELFGEYYRKPQENLVIFEWQHSCADFAKIVREGFDGVRRDVAGSRP